MWPGVGAFFSVFPLPWLLPGVALALLVSLAVRGPLAQWLGVSRRVAWTILFSTGTILAVTVTPLRSEYWNGPQPCHISRIGPPGIADLMGTPDVIGNILMFIPLGFAIALAPRSTRRAAVLAMAFCLPLLIEATQLEVSGLRRACQSFDVIDNQLGLVLGLVGGIVAARLSPTVRRAPDGPQSAEEGVDLSDPGPDDREPAMPRVGR